MNYKKYSSVFCVAGISLVILLCTFFSTSKKYGFAPVQVVSTGSGSSAISSFPSGSTSTGQTSTSGTPNVIPMGFYTTSTFTLSSTNTNPLLIDSSGNLKVAEQFQDKFVDNVNSVAAMQILPLAASTYSYSKSQQNLFQTVNIKGSAGNLYSLTCFNGSSSTHFAQVFNTATTPAGNAVADQTFAVPSQSQIIIGNDYFGPSGLYYSLGIALGNSFSSTTYVAANSGDIVCNANYK